MPAIVVTLAATVALAVAPRAPDPRARRAIEGALALAGARVEVTAVEGRPAPGCAVERAVAPRVPRASGRAAVRLLGDDGSGRPCEAWVWVRVRVLAPTVVTTRAVAEGEPLEAAVAVVERESRSGGPALASLPDGARAARRIAAGIALDPAMIRVGPAPGTPVVVAARAGALVVEQRATAVACARGRACAMLPSGRRVEGTWHDGRIAVGSP